MELITAYRNVQTIAKAVLRDLASTITADDTEESIAKRAVGALQQRGIQDTWYYDCPALVLLGSRSCLSISGRHYVAAREPVGQTNLVTIDLSPRVGDVWGDCARSFAVEQGRVVADPESASFSSGLMFLRELHESMRRYVTPTTTFHELALWTSGRIDAAGFVNLDFRGNAGHSLATRREDRLYIEAGQNRVLADAGFFTFEPHVQRKGGRWGFKHEDVFFFDAAGVLRVL